MSPGDKLADALRRRPRERWAWTPDLLHWAALVLGAACGTAGYDAWGLLALLVPAAGAAAFAVVTVTIPA